MDPPNCHFLLFMYLSNCRLYIRCNFSQFSSQNTAQVEVWTPLIQATMALVLLFLLAIFLLFLRQVHKIKSSSSSNNNKNLPPGPKKLPLIGNLHQLELNSPHVSLHRLSTLHGPLMSMQLGSVPTLIISSADAAQDVFKTHDIAFSGRPQLYSTSKMSYGGHDMAFAPYGEYWRQVRKLSVLELLSLKKVQSFSAVRQEEVAAVVRSIAATPPPAAVNLSELMLTLMNDITCRVAFGRKYGGQGLHGILRETQALIGGFCLADFFPWMKWAQGITGLKGRLDRNFKDLDELYDLVIEEHMLDRKKRLDGEAPPLTHEEEDFVDVLLGLREDSAAHGMVLDNMDAIKGLLTDIFIAGTDTSSALVVWTMAELLRNPRILAKVQVEVRNTISTTKSKIEESDLLNLHFLKLVIKESLRLHPPVPLLVPRETTQTCQIQKYVIPTGTRVFVNVRAIGRDVSYWDKPDEFWPERFLNNGCTKVEYKGQDFQLIPFGTGRRSCPGIGFASTIVELVLANLLCWFDWEVGGDDFDMEEAFGMTMHKKNPLWLIATPVGGVGSPP